jgi:O-antigen/teichoic acid export membrane protein
VLDVLKVVPVLLVSAFFPALARFAGTRESFLETIRSLLTYSLLLMLVMVSAAFYAAPYIEIALYGSQFIEATPLLRALLGSFLAMFFNHIFSQVLIAKDREHQLVPAALVACGSNLAFSWVWIPRLGTMGACYALIASESIYLVLQGKLLIDAVPGLFNPFRRTFG